MLDFSDAPTEQLIDVAEVRRSLVECMESWLPNVLPEGREICGDYRAGSVRGEKGGSLSVALRGEKRGLWFDHATGESGDVFDLIMSALGTDFAGALQYAQNIASITPRTLAASIAAVRDKAWSREFMAGILSGARPVSGGDPVARYLADRRLKPAGDLALHPALRHAPSGTTWPVMLATVRNASGAPVGIHRTWIDPHTGTKAPVSPNRMMLGPCTGGAVRLSEAVDTVGVCEGIETGLAAMRLEPNLPVWAALSTSGMRAIELPQPIKLVIILADNDEAGEAAAQGLAARLLCEGRDVKIARPQSGKDFNDELLQKGSK